MEVGGRTHSAAGGGFSLRSMLGLLTVLAAILAVSRAAEDWFWTPLVFGAAVGIFLAEYFGTTQRRQYVLLVGTPCLCATAIHIYLVVNQDNQASVVEILPWAALYSLALVIPSVITVVALNLACATIFRLTGWRLLKFDWSEPPKASSR